MLKNSGRSATTAFRKTDFFISGG